MSTFGDGPKIFLKAFSAPKYTNFEGGAKKTRFLVKMFQKIPENAFLAFFFKILPVAQKLWPKQRLFSALGEL